MSVPKHLRHFHYDPVTGRELTQAERAEKYAAIRFNQERGDASTLPGTVEDRQSFRRAQTNVDIVVKQRVAEKAREGRGPRNVFRERQQYLEDAGAPQSHIEPHRIAADKLDRERQEQARQAAYQSNDSVRLMLEHAAATEASHRAIWPNAELDEVGYILATARSTEFVDPAQHAAAYWQAVSDIETKMYSREETILAAKAAATAAVTVDHLAQAQRADAAKARLAVAVENLGGADAQ